MIARPEATGLLGCLETVLGHEAVDQLFEANAGAGAMHHHLVAVEPADHVEVDHRHGVGEGHRRVGRVVAAPEQTPLFTGKRHE